MFKKVLNMLRGKVADEKLDAFEEAVDAGRFNKTVEVEGPSSPAEQLEDYQLAGINRVKVLSQRDDHACAHCFGADGDEYTLEEAIERQILPHDGCENDTCRCSYRPLLDE